MCRRDLNKILKELLKLDGNESSSFTTEQYNKFIKLIIEITKAINNIRYCSKRLCSCHPEYKIKELLEDKDFMKLIDEACCDNISERLDEWCNTYRIITIWKE